MISSTEKQGASNKPQSDPKLYIVMVGLPARGKSTIATKLKENLVHNSVRTRIFNNGELRRKMIHENTSFPDFFAPYRPDQIVGPPLLAPGETPPTSPSA